ncbi:unnamed protein product [Didymodactylos carnosus]|uniref:Uncharacterized protein n=1 Tax=Didymodactylos carnosus TaxID=1234261 RepID=A0A815EJB9_9BILA|nr:unnamed protein product [Didymodactylos carnosus]CAF1312693.1 unnamed protein product [Didymodactylos carnosus]CAF4048638.1 unnamed protein product [Didymodactylos carnosus]CAF4151712.1 unnamed protein product [Didymodactylos carnosus]
MALSGIVAGLCRDRNCTSLFRPALPQTILKADNSARSFMTLAKYGTSKTLLRCEYFKSLPSNNYLKISILNRQISEYLDRYVSGKNLTREDCQNEKCLINWSENEFAQLILSSLVTELMDTHHNKQLSFLDLSLDEKIYLIAIICYYYNGVGTSKLEHFVNSFLGKRRGSLYLASQAQVQVQERNIFHEKLLLTHLKNDFERFTILKKDDERLHLLLAILEGEKFEHDAGRKHLYGNIFRDLTRFSVFGKNSLNKTPVFIINGIDENGYFFHKNEVNRVSLELFCRSSVSQDILYMVMANHFYLSVFYPKIDGINIEDAIIRKDKFPTHTITWNTKSLVNYADYVLQQMNKNATETRCKPFTDFKTLVNFSNKKIAVIIEKIPTPRALHYFMSALILEMNNDANSVKRFEATFENVHAAYEESYPSYEKRHKIKE